MTRKRRSDAGMTRGPRAAKIEHPGRITTKDMKGRFANSTSYAALAGIDKSYQYKCRDCGVLFNREGAYDHYPQDCTKIMPPIAVGTVHPNLLPPTVYPGKTPLTGQAKPLARIPEAQPAITADPQPLTLDIKDLVDYLEWLTKDRNEARRELESTRAQLADVREANLSKEFWTTYREYRKR